MASQGRPEHTVSAVIGPVHEPMEADSFEGQGAARIEV